MLDETESNAWVRTTIGDLGRYLNGRAFKSSEWAKSGRPIIRIQDLTGSNQHPNYFAGDIEDRYVVRPGDFLISWSATLGAYIWDGPEAVLNQHIFKVDSRINKKFHYHLMRNSIAELERNAHGSGMVHVTKGIFEATPVTVPESVAAQEAIGALLDVAQDRQLSAQAHVQSAQHAVERLRAVLLGAACTGSLTGDWRAAHPGTASMEIPNAIRKRGHLQEQAVDMELPELPATYTSSRIGNCVEVLEYGTSVRCEPDPELGVAVLRMGNIQNGELDFSDLKYSRADEEIKRLLLRDGDLLFNRTNSPELVGKSAVFHGDRVASFASYLIRARFRSDIAHPDFVNYWINSAYGRGWAQLAKTDGVSQSNINGTKLSLMPLPLPPIAEQREIVRRVEAMLRMIEGLIVRIEAVERQIARSSQAVLSKVLRGELAVRKQ